MINYIFACNFKGEGPDLHIVMANEFFQIDF